MAVEVTVGRAPSGTPTKVERHESGKQVNVSDGHLYVASAYSSRLEHLIAVYAPGTWVTAMVSDEKNAT